MIADENQKPLPINTVGEILVKGANVMIGYLYQPEETSKTINRQGWLRTGDLGRLDSDGFVFVTGRIKELIIKGGENIAPRDIDEAVHRRQLRQAGAEGQLSGLKSPVAAMAAGLSITPVLQRLLPTPELDRRPGRSDGRSLNNLNLL